MDRETAREQANGLLATNRIVAFPANVKVYTGGKAPAIDVWVVRAARLADAEVKWTYLDSPAECDRYRDFRPAPAK